MGQDTCRYDHHGYCQTHSLGSELADGRCLDGVVEFMLEVDVTQTTTHILDLYRVMHSEPEA